MSRFQLTLAAIFTVVFLIAAGCDSTESDLLDRYQRHVSSAQEVVSDQKDGSGVSDMAYQSEMNGHVDGMASTREQMGDQCAPVDACMMGGGATGEVMNGYMSGGQMLSPEEMDEMHEGEMQLQEEMDAFEMHCIGVDAGMEDCDAYRADHYDSMHDMLQDHYDSCNRMMGNNGHMMNGGDGMMSR
jgi:hypothetical protein